MLVDIKVCSVFTSARSMTECVIVKNGKFNCAYLLFSRCISHATTSRGDVADATAASHATHRVLLMQSLSWFQSLACTFSLSLSLQHVSYIFPLIHSSLVSGLVS